MSASTEILHSQKSPLEYCCRVFVTSTECVFRCWTGTRAYPFLCFCLSKMSTATFFVMVTKWKVLSVVIRDIYICIQFRCSPYDLIFCKKCLHFDFFFSTHIYTWSPTLLPLYRCPTYPRGANVFKLISFRGVASVCMTSTKHFRNGRHSSFTVACYFVPLFTWVTYRAR
jgi:hypothetical protein